MELALEDKIVVVTGASGTIGQAVCKAFLAEKAYVTAIYKSNVQAIEKLQDRAQEEQTTKNFHAVQADITGAHTAENIIDEILERHGRIDVLVNAAGITFENLFLMTEDEDWEKLWNTNFTATMKICREVLRPMMRRNSGSIINISSVLAGKYGRGAIAYAVSKSAIERFTQTLALETGKKGIRVNAVAPGIVESEMAMQVISSMGNKLLENTPLNRYGKADEIAQTVLFLASENASSFITGQVLHVDGGLSV